MLISLNLYLMLAVVSLWVFLETSGCFIHSKSVSEHPPSAEQNFQCDWFFVSFSFFQDI